MRLIFAGTPPIAAQALSDLARVHEVCLVITRPDAPSGRKRVITPSPVAARAQELGIPVLKTNKLGANDLQQLKDAGADLCLVVAFGSIIPQAALEIMPWWNLHFSLLPQWRGATPLQHSIIEHTGIGISVFEIERGLDTGPLIAQLPMTIGPDEIASEALERFTTAGMKLVLDALKDMPKPNPQQGETSLAPKISRDQARISLRKSATELAAFINALNPEPGAWSEVNGQVIKLMRARPIARSDAGSSSSSKPGTISVVEGKALLEVEDGSRLELIEVQPAGKQIMRATDWLRGHGSEVKIG